MGCKWHCDGCTVGRVWHAPDRSELFPEEQWCNMSDEDQEELEGSGAQGEQQEELRAERDRGRGRCRRI